MQTKNLTFFVKMLTAFLTLVVGALLIDSRIYSTFDEYEIGFSKNGSAQKLPDYATTVHNEVSGQRKVFPYVTITNLNLSFNCCDSCQMRDEIKFGSRTQIGIGLTQSIMYTVKFGRNCGSDASIKCKSVFLSQRFWS